MRDDRRKLWALLILTLLFLLTGCGNTEEETKSEQMYFVSFTWDASIGYLLDSCMEHTAGRETDGNIQSAVLHMPWEPGFHLQKGNLYCANEEWELLREESLGNLYFGEDGRYVSGDPELDAIVETLIFQFQQENEESDRYELL